MMMVVIVYILIELQRDSEKCILEDIVFIQVQMGVGIKRCNY